MLKDKTVGCPEPGALWAGRRGPVGPISHRQLPVVLRLRARRIGVPLLPAL